MGQSHLQMGQELSANGLRVICKWVRSYLQMGQKLTANGLRVICKLVRVICKWAKNYLQMSQELSANGLRVICKWVKRHFATKCSPTFCPQICEVQRGSWIPVQQLHTQCVPVQIHKRNLHNCLPTPRKHYWKKGGLNPSLTITSKDLSQISQAQDNLRGYRPSQVATNLRWRGGRVEFRKCVRPQIKKKFKNHLTKNYMKYESHPVQI